MLHKPVRLWGSPVTLSPLGPVDLADSAPPKIFKRAIIAAPSRPHCNALARGDAGRTIEISVLGASVTAGCGAASPRHVCWPQGSHSHHLYERLTRRLAAAKSAASVSVNMWGKNAVGLDYFSICPGRFQLSANTTVVLIEGEPAMAFHLARGNQAHLRVYASSLVGLTQGLRRVAPNAVFGFLGWSMLTKNVSRLFRDEISFAKYVHEYDPSIEFAFASSLLTDLEQHRSWSNTSAADFFRSLYADGAHPNREGHALLGELGARLVFDALLRDADRQQCQAPHSERGDTGTMQPPDDPRRGGSREWCYLSADDIPVVQPLEPGIDLKDEGGDKEIKKLGFVSHSPGSTLSVGPIAPSAQCGLFEVSLGYLQSWRPHQGSFRLKCVGCECTKMPGMFARGANPFPVVNTLTSTDAKAGNGHRTHELVNASLTMFTKFMLFKSAETCFLNVTHLPMTERKTRIRIDAIGIELASCASTCALTARPWSKRFGMRSRMECLPWAKAGRPGYLMPRCFNKTALCRAAHFDPLYNTY